MAKGERLTVKFMNVDESFYAKAYIGKQLKKFIEKTSDSSRGNTFL